MLRSRLIWSYVAASFTTTLCIPDCDGKVKRKPSFTNGGRDQTQILTGMYRYQQKQSHCTSKTYARLSQRQS
jgi:hypothetical protein